jgi:hypothetical protein
MNKLRSIALAGVVLIVMGLSSTASSSCKGKVGSDGRPKQRQVTITSLKADRALRCVPSQSCEAAQGQRTEQY